MSMSQTRAKDLLDAKDYTKLLKANVSEIRESDFNLVQVEKIIENYRDLLADIAERTGRMNEAPLKNGTLQCFDVAPRTATFVAGAFRFCVDKSRFYTTKPTSYFCNKLLFYRETMEAPASKWKHIRVLISNVDM